MHSDFRELLRIFNANGVRYLVVGGYAVMEYTEPRYTKDLDLWIAPDLQNAAAVYRSLAEFGAPLGEVTPEDFAQEGNVYQIGISPVRIDILVSIEGVQFEDAWTRRVERSLGDLTVPILSREDLVRNKRAAGRPQDRIDAKRLEAARRRQSRREPGRGGSAAGD
jgi:hypothetical protein